MRQNPRRLLVIATGIIATLFLSLAATNVTTSQTQNSGGNKGKSQSGKQPQPKAGQATGRRQYEPLKIKKSDHLGPQNVAKSVSLNFDKTLKDATGKMRRVQINKAELLKTPGVRYYAKVDGEPRDITYLILDGGKIAVVNVEGTKPEHNLYKHRFQEPATKGFVAEYKTPNRVLTEIAFPSVKTAKRRTVKFSMPQRYVDSYSFALHRVDPINVDGLMPGEHFRSGDDDGGVRPPGPVRPPDWGNLFPPIEILFHCIFTPKNIEKCGGGCENFGETGSAEPAETLTVGVSARKTCKESGCIQCAGVCCEPTLCTSETNPEPFFDCTIGAGTGL